MQSFNLVEMWHSMGFIARAVVFLVRDAPFVTGQVLNVDGGRSSVL